MSTFRGIQKKKIYKDTKRRGKRVRVNIKAMNLTIQEGKRENREESWLLVPTLWDTEDIVWRDRNRFNKVDSLKFKYVMNYFQYHLILNGWYSSEWEWCDHIWVFFFFFIVVDFVIHLNETAMGLHVFPIPVPPPTSLSTLSL